MQRWLQGILGPSAAREHAELVYSSALVPMAAVCYSPFLLDAMKRELSEVMLS